MTRSTLETAIRNKRVIMFTYKYSLRTVEPHLLGISNTGVLTLSAYQLLGGSGQGWRDFHIGKIHGITTTGQSFVQPRLGYNPFDTTMSQILARV